MVNKSEKKYGNVTVVQRSDYSWGVVDDNGNEIVPFGKYGWIDGFEQGLARVRTKKRLGYARNITAIIDLANNKVINDKQAIQASIDEERKKNPDAFAKWGIINTKGEEVLPVEYDNIWNFLGKNRFSTQVEKDGVAREVYFHDLNPELPKRGIHRTRQEHYDRDDYGTHYGEFTGSYAQDVMGYSDDVINDAFEGDPDMYWNID